MNDALDKIIEQSQILVNNGPNEKGGKEVFVIEVGNVKLTDEDVKDFIRDMKEKWGMKTDGDLFLPTKDQSK